jgi:hypothetical protein
MASYQCSGPIYRITIKMPYNVLEHHVTASYQCSGPIYRITITRPYNDLLVHHVMAYIQDHNNEVLLTFGASCNGLISMLGPIYKITITRPYNVWSIM